MYFFTYKYRIINFNYFEVFLVINKVNEKDKSYHKFDNRYLGDLLNIDTTLGDTWYSLTILFIGT